MLLLGLLLLGGVCFGRRLMMVNFLFTIVIINIRHIIPSCVIIIIMLRSHSLNGSNMCEAKTSKMRHFIDCNSWHYHNLHIAGGLKSNLSTAILNNVTKAATNDMQVLFVTKLNSFRELDGSHCIVDV